MASRGKSINLFLMDGEASGRIKCTLANWTGIAYKIPRTELEKCRERDDLKQSGVYFLFGTSDQTGKNVLFNSPSYAAAFVIGGHANGLTEWKTEDGKTLKNIEQEEI